MSSIHDLSLRFVRWGLSLTVLGLVTGYFPLMHYLMDDSMPSCPTAPVHGHTILLSFVGMPIFGLLYHGLPSWSNRPLPIGLVRAHFWLAVTAIIGVSVNGTIVYELLKHGVQEEFYYLEAQGQSVRNLWFGIDGAFLTLYGIGCAILLYVFMTRTAYAGREQPVATNPGASWAGTAK